MAYPEGFPEHIHNSFSPYKEWIIPYMVKMNFEYAQETPLDTPLHWGFKIHAIVKCGTYSTVVIMQAV